MMRSALVFLAGIVVLGGCASVVPQALQEQVDREVRFSDLQPDPARYEGRMVVLGGRIAALRPVDDLTEIEITELPLSEPRDSPKLFGPSGGRFVVAHQGPLDPERYRPGLPITVVGRVQGARTSPGQDVPAPVIEAEYLYVWRPPTRRLAPAPSALFTPDPFHGFHPFHGRFRLFRPGFCD